MKTFKKKPAIALIIVLSIVLIVGAIFAFIPMQFGHNSYKSFAGAIRVGNDFSAGMYAEYDIAPDGAAGTNDINKSISQIKNVLSEKGYASTNVYAVGDEKIRVEVSYENGGSNFRNAYSLLKAVGVGAFELRSSSNEDDTYVIGSKHISDVEISTYTSSTFVTLKFNNDGKKAYEELLGAGKTIYVCMGGATQTSFSTENTNTSDYSQLQLTLSDYSSAVDFATKVKFGSIPVELNKDTAVINTVGVRSSMLACIIGIAVLAVAILAFFAIRYGIMGVMNIISTLFAAIIATMLFWAIPSVEINVTALLAIVAGFAISAAMKCIYTERVRGEYLSGKTIEASLDSGYRKSISGVATFGVTALIAALVMSIVSGGILQTASVVIAIFALIGAFESLFLLPLLVSLVETFNRGKDKIYHFKREEV